MLVTRIFSIFHNVFYPIKGILRRLSQSENVVCEPLQFYQVQNLVVWWSIDPFLNLPFWVCPKFKESADENWNVAI